MFTSQAIKPYKIVSHVPIQNYQIINTTKQNTKIVFLYKTHNTYEKKMPHQKCKDQPLEAY